jgi:acetyl-CoA carboxylase beta subunit
MLAHESLLHLKSQTGFQAVGEPVGNLTLGRGQLQGAPVYLAIVENKIASGSLGSKESDKLASLFKVVAAQKSPLLMYLDSAGARVSEGLPALGAFRHMYRAALTMAASAAPVAAVCGANCFGGASMLASLAGTRYFSTNTRFAMSGPAILAQSAGVSVLDEMFQAMSHAAIGRDSRVKLGAGNAAVPSALPLPVAVSAAENHAQLGARLATISSGKVGSAVEKIERKDFAKLYPEGYDAQERGGVVTGEAQYQGEKIAVLGVVNGKLLGAAAAWSMADAVWKHIAQPPRSLHVLVDCESHATSMDDERVMLSVYLADLAAALHALGRAGTKIETTVLGKLGGGVYVALAAPSEQVNLVYGTHIQLLPGAAIASILGDAAPDKFEFADYSKSRVADQELKLGLVDF